MVSVFVANPYTAKAQIIFVADNINNVVLAQDQRGYLRNVNTDIGAFEYGGFPPCTPLSSTFTVSACNSYTWVANGNTVYTASNNTDSIVLVNTVGCDSVVKLNLTILPNYTITATAGSNGSISDVGATIACGNKTYTITPNSGFAIDSVFVDGAFVGTAATYTFTNVVATHTIGAVFATFSGPAVALDFNGTNNFLSIPHNANLNLNKLTIETWIKATNTNDVQFICSKEVTAMEIHLAPGGGIRFIPTAGVFLDAPAGTIPNNTWFHLACTYDPANRLSKMYINAQEVNLTIANFPTNTPIAFNTAPFTIGARTTI